MSAVLSVTIAVTLAVTLAVALVAAVWASGGLRADPRPRPRGLARTIDLGLFAVSVTDAVLHRPTGSAGLDVSPVALDVTLRVTDKGTRSVQLKDLTENALALDSAGGPKVVPRRAIGYSQGAEVRVLHPAVPLTVVLSYGLASASVPAAFHARLVLWAYDHREDFFYGHVQWKQRKPADPQADDPGDFAVRLPIRREGV